MANILWIEDEALKLKGLVRPLIKSGDVVTFAFTKAESIEILRNQSFDLIILDIIIPDDGSSSKKPKLNDFEGIELLRILKETRCNIPVVVLTVVDDEEAIDIINKLGARKTLRKGSYLPSDLKKEVDRILQR